MRFSHIVVTKDRPSSLRASLHGICATVPADGEIIVVDGDPGRSAESIVKQVESANGGAPIHYLSGVSGICAQRNAGLEVARGDVVIFTDDDCVPASGFYDALAQAYADPDVVGVTGRVLQPSSTRIGSDVESSLRRTVLGGGRQGSMTSFGFRRPIVDLDIARRIEYMPGTNMSARRAAALEVGFDENLQHLGGYSLCEDDDFSYRLSRKGAIEYAPAAAVHHDLVGEGTRNRRELDRSVVANRTYLFRKNFRPTVRAKLGFATLLAVLFGHRILNREWQGVRGLLDGLRDVWRGDLPGG
jgi:glycosyltransferase involved in cell wall biosynthesis